MIKFHASGILILISFGVVVFADMPAIAGSNSQESFDGGSSTVTCANTLSENATTGLYDLRGGQGVNFLFVTVDILFDSVENKSDVNIPFPPNRATGILVRNSLSTIATLDGEVEAVVARNGRFFYQPYPVNAISTTCDPQPTTGGNPNPPSPPNPNNPPNPPQTCGNPPLPYCAYLDNLSGVKAANALEEEILKHRNSISQINKITEAAINSPSSLIVKDRAGQVAKISSLTLDPSTQLFIKEKKSHLD